MDKEGLIISAVWSLLYAGYLVVGSWNNQYIGDYIVNKGRDRTTVSAQFNNPYSGILVDKNNDGMPDRKYSVIASRQGRFVHDLPITEQDRQIFSDITSKLK